MGQDNIKIEPEAKLAIPRTLNHWLIADFDLINKQKKILHLPARVTVARILEKYVHEKTSVEEVSPELESTIVLVSDRIRDCFNVLLGKRLLYKSERPQHDEILVEHVDKEMCEIYGVNHLVRMFTTLGSMMLSISETERALTPLILHIQDFMKFLATNSSFFSTDDYEDATPEYQRRVELLT